MRPGGGACGRGIAARGWLPVPRVAAGGEDVGEPAKPSPLIEKMGELAAELDSYRAGALGREREAGEQRLAAGARTQGAQGAQAGKRARRRPGPGGRKGRAKGRG
jgi:hypothetical protein